MSNIFKKIKIYCPLAIKRAITKNECFMKLNELAIIGKSFEEVIWKNILKEVSQTFEDFHRKLSTFLPYLLDTTSIPFHLLFKVYYTLIIYD